MVARTTPLAVLLALLATAAGGATAAAVKDAPPTVALATAAGESLATHVRDEPLLLYVSIYNGLAGPLTNRNARNQRFLERYRESEEFRTLPAATQQEIVSRFAPVDIPTIRLGSDAAPLTELVEIQIAGADGRWTALPARSLAANAEVPAAVELAGDAPVRLAFGIGAETLAGLATGEHTLRAIVDSRDRAGMWQGVAPSRPITLNLIDRDPSEADADSSLRSFLLGRYHLADYEYERAAAIADDMLSRDPSFVGGWLIRGDALAGQERLEEALEAFRQALRLYYQPATEEPPGPREHPEYTARRIYELGQRLASP